ncbi:MAG: hypothetical protein B7Y51_05845 [Burkholderiales bacterium 28-67-8]|nr:MAG: hypothetical protein B7Y51_05845 [Burkholderiales bacterium 28-67-8]
MPMRRLFKLLALWLLLATGAAHASTLTISSALSVNGGPGRLPSNAVPQQVSLPDDWAVTRPDHDGSVWYRAYFIRPADVADNELLALYIERACSNIEIRLNGRRIFSGGRMVEPLTNHCYRPLRITLPAALLSAHENVLDIEVSGSSLRHVASRARAGGLSQLQIGPQAELVEAYSRRHFWNIAVVQVAGVGLLALGGFLLVLSWMNRSEVFLLHFGTLIIGWALLSMRVWWSDLPMTTQTFEFVAAVAFAPMLSLAVHFLLNHARTDCRRVAGALLLQCVLVPASLAVAGTDRLFTVANVWFVLMAVELVVAGAWYLKVIWSMRRDDFWPMGLTFGGLGALVLLELAIQFGALPRLAVHPLSVFSPLLLLVIGSRLLLVFGRAMQAAEANRAQLEIRVAEATAEVERNFMQMSTLRMEQVTEKERKRIAADLHDDLGAKLLTIVHTSDSERISNLAREALEEMRLSVKGLTGRPVQLADALADWRAEAVSRLGQANIEADWRNPSEDLVQTLSARAFVQTTRILRESVSNIIKHSRASQCKVRVTVSDADFGLVVQDNGRGISVEPDSKLDRGHGMASMKHRAKTMQGQCLVESAPGYGTLIRLTIPF